MPSAVETLTIAQLGRETTKGTAVAQTTRWVGMTQVTPDEPRFWARTQNGLMVPRSQRGTIATRITNVRLESDLTFEQILHVLNMCMTGLTTGTGAGADKTWQFTPSVTADPLLNSFTLGYRLTDGTTNWDNRAAYLLGRSFEISANIGENAKIMMEGFARPVELATAITGAIAVPSVNYVPAASFKWYLNDTFGALGTTQKLGTLISWRLRYDAPYQPKFYQDGLANRSFSSHGLKDSDYSLEMTVEFTADIAAEQAKADDDPNALRYIRLEALGAVLGGSFYEIEIDGSFEVEPGQFHVDGERDGNPTATIRYVGSYDVTNSLGLKIKVINALAALP
jgi:hypothetical protein